MTIFGQEKYQGEFIMSEEKHFLPYEIVPLSGEEVERRLKVVTAKIIFTTLLEKFIKNFDFTESEKDSLIEGIKEDLRKYKNEVNNG